MPNPRVKQHGVPPPGVMPRNIQYVVLAAIALLVVVATLWSGGKPRKSEEHAPPPATSTPGQLQTFQQMLERQRHEADQEADTRRKRLIQEQQAPAEGSAPIPSPPSAAAPDPIEEQSRKRTATAPFASSYVVRAEGAEAVEKGKLTEPDDKTVILLLGPVFIPFKIVPQMDWMFWGWLRAFMQYAFYQLIASAYVFVFGQFLMRILGAQAGGAMSSSDVTVLFVPLVLTLVTFVLGTFKVPALTNAIFSGRAGDYVTLHWR